MYVDNLSTPQRYNYFRIYQKINVASTSASTSIYRDIGKYELSLACHQQIFKEYKFKVLKKIFAK